MRAWVLVLLLAPTAVAQGDEFVDRDGWTQFIPDWRPGPASPVFQGSAHDVPAGVHYATDGETWFYATNDTIDALRERPGCGPGDDGTYVLVRSKACVLAPHPGIACSGSDACGPQHALSPVPTFPLDSCGRVQHARCTPGLPLGLVTMLLAAAALTWPSSGRGRA